MIAAHGGLLVNRFTPDADALRGRAATLPKVTLDARELADLELLAVGAVSPLTGFLGQRDYTRVVEEMRLADGTVWPLPLTLAVDTAPTGTELALHDATGRLWGTLRVESVFTRDPLHEAKHVYGTEDLAHPGVAYLASRPRTLVGGTVEVLPLPDDLPFARFRLTPTQLRAELEKRGWKTAAGFQTRNPIHRAHEHLTKLALEVCDGLVLHPLVGETKSDDVPASVRFDIYETLVEKYYPQARTVLAAFPAAMRYAGPREAIFHALVRKNYGLTHLIVGRDHAGVGKYYAPTAAQELFERFTQAELGVTPLKFEPTFYCRVCESIASSRSCPHGVEARLELSGTRVRELLRDGQPLPREFTRPEVAEVLRRHFGGQPPRAEHRPGFIVWFTGLSGAGKSTLARALKDVLLAQSSVEVLDGDEVRTYLSKGLGFSKEDRDTNIRRIGFVARAVARNGAIAIGAAISPYAGARDEVRQLAQQDGVEFVEVHVTAAMDSLVARDTKGLYKKALAGELANFTGVSDPYEAPVKPDLRLETDREDATASLGRIVALLHVRGLVK
jgi:sulfate adenylyltransferase